ncbi:MAG: FecR family protein [Anaerolineales bacterium]|nr:FecR family protein [Anaerolineales bacterium]
MKKHFRTVSVCSLLFTVSWLAASCQRAPQTALPAEAPFSATPMQVLTVTATPRPALALNAVLSEVGGVVEAKQPTGVEFIIAHDGTTIKEEGQVRTLENSSARLDLSTGTLIRMAPLSYFTLLANQAVDDGLLTRIRLEFRQLWVILSGGAVEIETPNGLAAVRGSYMMVEIDPKTQSTLVSCLEGTCALSGPAGTLRLGTGQRAELLPPALTDGEYRLPVIQPLTEEDIRAWLAFNPEAERILPEVRATLASMPTLDPDQDISLTPGAARTRIANPTLPAILPTSDEILPTQDGDGILPGILPTIVATRTPFFGN